MQISSSAKKKPGSESLHYLLNTKINQKVTHPFQQNLMVIVINNRTFFRYTS